MRTTGKFNRARSFFLDFEASLAISPRSRARRVQDPGIVVFGISQHETPKKRRGEGCEKLNGARARLEFSMLFDSSRVRKRKKENWVPSLSSANLSLCLSLFSLPFFLRLLRRHRKGIITAERKRIMARKRG